MEKPFASAAREVRELRDLALANHWYVFEAVTLHYLPNFAAIKEALPKLGKIKAVVANYSQYSSRYDKYLQGEVLPAFDPQRGGGALYDINIYNLNLIIGLFGAPESITYTANLGFNGIDTPNELRSFEMNIRGSGVTTHSELNKYSHRMVHEFQEFARIFHAGDYERVKQGLETSVAVLETAEEARRQVGIVFPCDGEQA